MSVLFGSDDGEVSVKQYVILYVMLYAVHGYAMHIDLKQFHNIVRSNNVVTVSALLKNCPQVIGLANDQQETALHVAALECERTMVDLLIEHNAVVDAKDAYGETPLFKAVLIGREDNVEALIKAGSHVNILRGNENLSSKDRYRYTPLQLACTLGHVKVVEMLLKAGADRAITGDLKTVQEIAHECPYNQGALLEVLQKK